jgi:hypothetical protein
MRQTRPHLGHQLKWKPCCAFSYTSFINNLLHQTLSKCKWFSNATCNIGHTFSSHVQPAHIKKDLTSRIQSCNLLNTEDHITQMSNSFYILIIILLTAMKEKLLQDGTECNGLTGLPSTQQ